MIDKIELHRQLITRIQHEDNILQQRTYNFFTANTFLAASLALTLSRLDEFAFLYWMIAILGLSLSLFQAMLGRRTERAILFWRTYAGAIESKLHMPLDSALFIYYERATVNIPGGRIVAGDKHRRPMYRIFPWNVISSTNVIVGVLIPVLLALFWVGSLWAIAMIHGYIGGQLLAGTSTIVAAVLVFSVCFFVPALPRSDLDTHQDDFGDN